MKEFFDYVVKNKYIILCVAIVVLLYALGVIDFISKVVILLILIAFAVYLGKKIQDNDKIVKKIFTMKFTDSDKSENDEKVYYYQEKNEHKND